MASERSTGFLNVDLELRAKSSCLDKLVRALEPSAVVVHRAPTAVTLELLRQPASPDDAIVRFADAITRLPSDTRAIWDQCDLRQMNIGIQGGETPHKAHFAISLNSLTLLAAIRAEILITIYS